MTIGSISAALAGLSFAAVLVIRFRWRALLLLAAIVLGLAGVLGAVEGAALLWQAVVPRWRVLNLQPDPALGWKQPPNANYTWEGTTGEFSVAVTTNSLGFRDLERRIDKPPGALRVALIGDSFFEALQVPFEQTAGRVLEGLLAERSGSPRAEVLNFGVSNWSAAQYLMAWREYVQRFRPDVVVVFTAPFIFLRTTEAWERGFFVADRPLWIRPGYQRKDGRLERVAARDYGTYERVVERLLEKGDRRARRVKVPPRGLLAPLVRRVLGRTPAANPPGTPVAGAKESVLLSLEILGELGEEVRRAGGRLVVADASTFFGHTNLDGILREFCRRNGHLYVPAAVVLNATRGAGRAVAFPRDGHLNERGNRVLAESILRWGFPADLRKP